MPANRKILFIANGNGEDSIAAAIIQKLPDFVQADAYPVVGSGKSYEGLCPIVGPRSEIPSEGWRHRAGSVARDIKGGMLQSVPPALRFLKSVRDQYDKIVVVGDAVGPMLCLLSGLRIDIYLDVFKSGYAHRYSGLERWLLRRTAKKTYCRDDMLASALRDAGLDALSKGNIMLDTVPYGTYDPAARRKHEQMITLLPGSREWTAESLQLQAAALEGLSAAEMPDVFVAVAGGVDVADLATATGLNHKAGEKSDEADLGTLSNGQLVIHLAKGSVGNLIEASDLVLSQAGTATQQALGMGKPVITFNRTDNRPKRMADEQALMGEARILTKPEKENVTQAVQKLLANPAEMRRLGEIGRTRLGGPGTLDAVVADLTG